MWFSLCNECYALNEGSLGNGVLETPLVCPQVRYVPQMDGVMGSIYLALTSLHLDQGSFRVTFKLGTVQQPAGTQVPFFRTPRGM